MTRNTRNFDDQATGRVTLVGAGPGDAGLITVRGRQRLREADVIVYDALANPELLDEARPDAELIDAGKRAKKHKLTQDETNALLADRARAGKRVVRLKGGDPYVFGRGSEEAIYLRGRGVPVEVVPGITAAIAGPAYAGIPVTHRNVATTCTFVTGHESPDKDQQQVEYEPLAALIQKGGTVCFYMGMGRLERIAERLIKLGCRAETPAAVVQWATMPAQRSVRSTLANVHNDATRAELGAPAIIVVGDVAGLDDQDALRWFEQRPLFGRTVLVTRTRQHASQLSAQLRELGAEVIEAPTIAIEPADDLDRVDQVVQNIGEYDWLVLTSANGAAALAEALRRIGRDSRHLASVKIAAVGEATAEALIDELNVRADLIPDRSTGEALADDLIAEHDVAGKRMLLLRADIARPALAEKLAAAGAPVDDVAAYRTLAVDALPESVLDALRDRRIDWLTFTSSSTARNLIDLLPDRSLIEGVKIASIGPSTSATIEQLGLTVTTEAERADITGLIQAILATEPPSDDQS